MTLDSFCAAFFAGFSCLPMVFGVSQADFRELVIFL